MERITNVRISTLTKVVPLEIDITVTSVAMSGTKMVVVDADDNAYELGTITVSNACVVQTVESHPSCGSDTSRANVIANLLRAVDGKDGKDGITPDMSDYYDKNEVEQKLSEKEDEITDLGAIRDGANKGRTAVQPSSLATVATSGSYTDLNNKPSIPAEVTETTVSSWGFTKNTGNYSKPASGIPASDLDPNVFLQGEKGDKGDKGDTGPQGPQGIQGPQGPKGDDGYVGDDGATFTPTVDSDGNLSWTNNKGLPNPDTVNIKGPKGDSGSGGGTGDLAGYATEDYVDNAVAAVNVKGEDGYVYSNGEKVDMRFTRSLLPTGTEITSSANLNTLAYLRVGKYYCVKTATAKTLKNCPTSEAFSMEVFNPLSVDVDDEETEDYVYRLRIITAYKTGIQYIQHASTGATPNKWTFDSWYILPRAKFALDTTDKNGGSAAVGGTTKPVYIDSTGEVKAISYSIAANVPSNAKFTDTKVTEVGNHYTPAEDANSALNAPEGNVVTGLKRDAAGHIVGIETAEQTGGGNLGAVDTEAELDDTTEYATKAYVDNLIISTLNTPV